MDQDDVRGLAAWSLLPDDAKRLLEDAASHERLAERQSQKLAPVRGWRWIELHLLQSIVSYQRLWELSQGLRLLGLIDVRGPSDNAGGTHRLRLTQVGRRLVEAATGNPPAAPRRRARPSR